MYKSIKKQRQLSKAQIWEWVVFHQRPDEKPPGGILARCGVGTVGFGAASSVTVGCGSGSASGCSSSDFRLDVLFIGAVAVLNTSPILDFG